MGEPVVYVSTWKIKEGKIEEYKRFQDRLQRTIDEAEPQIVAFLAFANDDGTEVTTVHVHPDRASVDKHMGVLAEKMGIMTDEMSAVFELMEAVHIEVCGQPGERALEMDQQLIDSGVPYAFKPRLISGFVRSR